MRNRSAGAVHFVSNRAKAKVATKQPGWIVKPHHSLKMESNGAGERAALLFLTCVSDSNLLYYEKLVTRSEA